ncbi:MAG: glycosyltransferase family A protein [Limosilactobacillus mucosae]
MKTIKYSIVIPAYNIHDYIEECINSILNQHRDDVEIIIVNDGSMDNTYEVCKKIKKDHPNIILIDKNNSGSMDSYIVGVKKSHGEYIGFVDSDDCIEDGYFRTLDKAIRNNSDVDVIMFDYNKFSKKQKELFKVNHIPYGKLSDELLNQLQKNYFAIYEKYSFYRWNKIYRSSLIKKCISEINFRVTYFEDLYLELLILLNAKRIIYINDSLYNYRLRMSSVTHTVSSKVFSDNRLVKKELSQLLVSYNKSKESIESMNEYMDYGYIRYYLRAKEKPSRIHIPFKMILNNKHKSHNKLLVMYKFRLDWLFNMAFRLRKQKIRKEILFK